jgi:putative oxidoreductase
VEFGLLLLRVVVGALFIGHGTQKLFGWFNGPGPEGTADMFRSLGYRRPRQMAIVAGSAEAGAGALLVLGLLTPLAAAAIIGVMLNAIVTVHRSNGLWNTAGGYEYNLVLIAVAATLAFAGPGMWAVDPGMAGPAWGVIALLLGAITATAVLATRRAPAEAEQEEHVRAA